MDLVQQAKVEAAGAQAGMAVVSYEMDPQIMPKSSDLSIQKVREIKAKRRNVKTHEVEYLVEWENKSLEQGQGGNGSGE